MIKLNGKIVQPTIFPDGTSQVWKLDFQDNGFHTIEWEFQHEAEFIHVAQLADLLHSTGALVNLVMPYLPYGRQDKEISNKTTFALQTFCRLLETCNFASITTLDAHSNIAFEYFYNTSSRFKNIFPEKEIKKALELSNPDFVLLPDGGAYNRYIAFLRNTDIHPLVGYKRRDQLTGEITGFGITLGYSNFSDNIELKKSVENKKFLILDDLVDGGGTFCAFAKSLKEEYNVKSVDLYCTHGIFSKGIKPLEEAGINRIFTRKGEVSRSKGTSFLIKEYV